MAQYTKLLEHEIQEIADQYELKLTDTVPIEGGAANSSYLLSTRPDKYILTIFESSPTFVAQMSQVLLLLAEHEFPAPRIQPLANGSLLTAYQGKPIFLKPYITGQVIKDIDDDQLSQLGAALASLHEIPAPDYLPDKHMYVTETYPMVMETGTDKTYMDWLRQRYEFLIQAIPANLPVGLTHGDLFYDNVLFED
ncbi:MAG: phosphotransferase, partial [Aquificales bacterium]|nr:phosphotransferase [Aquificales bacterium]